MGIHCARGVVAVGEGGRGEGPVTLTLTLTLIINPNPNPNPHPNPNPNPSPNPEQVDQLRAKSDMVESLLSVSATTIAKQLGAAEAQAEHPNDTYYKRLGCGLEPASAEEVAMLVEYPP